MEKRKFSSVGLTLVILCFASFLLYAVYFNSFGTNASAIMSFFRIDEAKNGMILTVQAVGCLVITILLSLFGERINKIKGIVLGLALMGAAGLLIGLLPVFLPTGGGYILMLGFSLLAGIGYITIDLLMNGVIADVFPEKKNTLLPFVHAFYGTGAMLAPLFVTALVNPGAARSFALPYLIVGVASLVVCLVLVFVCRKITPETPYADMTEIRSRAKGDPAEIFHDGRAWLYLLVCFMYVSFQTGISTWLPTYCTQKLGFTFENAGLMVTMYFLGSLIMRFLSPVVFKKFSVRSFYIVSLLASGALFLLFLFLPMSPGTARAMILLLGLLQGASVPALVILCCDAFPERTASASSLFVLAVSLSTMVIPALMGRLIEVSGYLTPMLVITGCLFLSVLALLPIKNMAPKIKN